MWTVEKANVNPQVTLTKTEEDKWEKFVSNIPQLGPAEAARTCGASDYKCLNSKTGQYQIRLSGKNRATFVVDDAKKTVRILQVGGHT